MKALTAALLSWTLAVPAAADGHPYLAVATALVMVNAYTVYRSVANALHSVAEKVVGLVLAVMTVRVLGPTAGAVAVIVLIAVLVGSAARPTTVSRSSRPRSSRWPPWRLIRWVVSCPPCSRH
jgi:xanthosine utilization system XapX-like protein